MRGLLLLAILLAPCGTALAAGTASLRPEQLRCEYRTNPPGIDVEQPRLSWVLTTGDTKAQNLKQSAYRVLAASSGANLGAGKGDLWDSGRVASDQSTQVVYGGKPLASGVPVFWKVQTWDQAGNASGWSAPAHWSMGLLKPADWKAKWIGHDDQQLYRNPSSPFQNLVKARWIWTSADAAAKATPGLRFFRTTFSVPADRKVAGAVCVLGVDSEFELFLNGHRIGRGGSPRMPEVFDIGPALKTGENLIAVRANRSKSGTSAGLIGAVRVDFAGGAPLTVTSSRAWKVTDNVPRGWEQPGYRDASWTAAVDLGQYGMAPWGDVGLAEERALPARMLRKEFTAKPVRRAVLYVSGLGLSEFYLNGRKIGDHVLSPSLTDYDKRVFYVTFDVTGQVRSGKNALGIMLGNGRYWAPRAEVPIGSRNFGYPKAIVQLEIEYADGIALRRGER